MSENPLAPSFETPPTRSDTQPLPPRKEPCATPLSIKLPPIQDLNSTPRGEPDSPAHISGRRSAGDPYLPATSAPAASLADPVSRAMTQSVPGTQTAAPAHPLSSANLTASIVTSSGDPASVLKSEPSSVSPRPTLTPAISLPPPSHPSAAPFSPSGYATPNMSHQPPMPNLPNGTLTDHWTEEEVAEILSYIKNNFQLWQQSKAVSYRKCREQLPNRTEKQIKNKVEKLISKYHKLCTWKATTADPQSQVRNWKWYTKLHEVFHTLDTTRPGSKGPLSSMGNGGNSGVPVSSPHSAGGHTAWKSAGSSDDRSSMGSDNPRAFPSELVRRHTTSSARPTIRTQHGGPHQMRMASPSVTAASSSLLALASAWKPNPEPSPRGGSSSSQHSSHPPPLSLPPIESESSAFAPFPRLPGEGLQNQPPPQFQGHPHSHLYNSRLRSQSASVVGEHPTMLRAPPGFDRHGGGPLRHPRVSGHPPPLMMSGHPHHRHHPNSSHSGSPLSPHHRPPPHQSGLDGPGHRDGRLRSPLHGAPEGVHYSQEHDAANRPRRSSMPVPPPGDSTVPPHQRPLENGMASPRSGQPRISLSFASDDVEWNYHPNGSGPTPPYSGTPTSGPSSPYTLTPSRFTAYPPPAGPGGPLPPPGQSGSNHYMPRIRAPIGHHHRHRHSVYESPNVQSPIWSENNSAGPSSAPYPQPAAGGPSSTGPAKRRKSFHDHPRPDLATGLGADPSPNEASRSPGFEHPLAHAGYPLATTASHPGSVGSENRNPADGGRPSPTTSYSAGAVPLVKPSPLGSRSNRILAITDQALHEKRKRVISHGVPENLQQLTQDIEGSISVQQGPSPKSPGRGSTRDTPMHSDAAIPTTMDCQRSSSLESPYCGQPTSSSPPQKYGPSGSSAQPHAKRLAVRRRAATVSEGARVPEYWSASMENSNGNHAHNQDGHPRDVPIGGMATAAHTLASITTSGSHSSSSSSSLSLGINEQPLSSSPLGSLTSSPGSSRMMSPRAFTASSTLSVASAHVNGSADGVTNASMESTRTVGDSAHQGLADLIRIGSGEDSVHFSRAGAQTRLSIGTTEVDLSQILPISYCQHIQPFVAHLIGTVQGLMDLKTQEIHLHHELQQVLRKLKQHQLGDKICESFSPDHSTQQVSVHSHSTSHGRYSFQLPASEDVDMSDSKDSNHPADLIHSTRQVCTGHSPISPSGPGFPGNHGSGEPMDMEMADAVELAMSLVKRASSLSSSTSSTSTSTSTPTTMNVPIESSDKHPTASPAEDLNTGTLLNEDRHKTPTESEGCGDTLATKQEGISPLNHSQELVLPAVSEA
ncbi:hypothetical protein BJ085DRAFT_28202 [Dimargaris cristalligena]|uniref:Uncharacterized protein n=1 Tax=Dimargaris cristalligena TaxID=215637 RepID=A0A4Q0A253_9FUNG|nr:hypothetical protein BJ085DRAFT_28202 [Dimargaris cristalligena]|eukprot:RKP40183.1 hypothetical protein BJ085DRAFT_28202 [Dimargaris cristalligena]